MHQFSLECSPHKLRKVVPKCRQTVAVNNLSSLFKVTSTNSIKQSQPKPAALADFEENDE